jgi:hypothetical protein
MMTMVQIGFAPRKLHMATSLAIFLVQLQSDRVSDILMLLCSQSFTTPAALACRYLFFFLALPHLIRQLLII